MRPSARPELRFRPGLVALDERAVPSATAAEPPASGPAAAPATDPGLVPGEWRAVSDPDGTVTAFIAVDTDNNVWLATDLEATTPTYSLLNQPPPPPGGLPPGTPPPPPKPPFPPPPKMPKLPGVLPDPIGSTGVGPIRATLYPDRIITGVTIGDQRDEQIIIQRVDHLGGRTEIVIIYALGKPYSKTIIIPLP